KEKVGVKLGTTVGGVIVSSKEALCFWVGDIKIFHFRNKILQRESHSHTLMNEVINKGSIIDVEQVSKYRHVVTRSVQGEVDRSQVDFFNVILDEDQDSFVICSDGVSDIFSGVQIQEIMNGSTSDAEAISNMEKHLSIHGQDNFSLIYTNFNQQ
ncbi:MAG: protein phosphatase 2C domain-containing protein, partial [Chryseobacterium sp.]|nr:protein phosphatase 2C domain-containing protein [Chryseobacterium sp.]